MVAILLLTIPVALSASPLRFSADGTFRILQLADLHVGEGQSDSKTLEVHEHGRGFEAWLTSKLQAWRCCLGHCRMLGCAA